MREIIPFLFFVIFILGAFYAFVCLLWMPVYFWFFRRVKRPDYLITPGQYCIEKMNGELTRREFFYLAGNSELKGYFYPNTESDKLVVLVHGFRSGADDFLPMIKELVCQGFNVFSFDATGTYDSQGRTLIGMCQRVIDLDKTLVFLKENEEFNRYKLYLLGHSLGGCASLSVLAIHPEVCACVALAPVNDAATLMLETAEGKIGKIARITKPFFYFAQKLSFGKYTDFNAVKGINACRIPVLIIQGDDDKVISYGRISVFANREKITNPKADFFLLTGLCGGHSSLWHSEKAVEYKENVDREYKRTKKLMGRRLDYGEKVKYFSNVNHNLYSQPNGALIQKIIGVFGSE